MISCHAELTEVMSDDYCKLVKNTPKRTVCGAGHCTCISGLLMSKAWIVCDKSKQLFTLNTSNKARYLAVY